MSLGETFSRLLLKCLVDDVFATGGVEALDAVVDFLTRCGERSDPRLTAALEQAMQRAWYALGAALGGDSFEDHRQAGLSPHDAQSLRRCLESVLSELAHGGGTDRKTVLVVSQALRRQCRNDVCGARAAGALAGTLDCEEWARSNEIFVRFVAPQGRPETKRRTEAQFLCDLEEHGCVGLMRLLTGAGGLPLLLMSARAFLCQELTHLLYRCLQECPEQTPNNCTLVLDLLHELSRPRFTVWRAPVLAQQTNPVHWSRLESRSDVRSSGGLRKPSAVHSPTRRRDAAPKRRNLRQSIGRSRPKRSTTEITPLASWALATVLTIVAALLVVLPIWMLVESVRQNDGERQRFADQRQHLRDERRRVDEERQRLLDEQRRIARQDEFQRQAIVRQREEAERQRAIEAEEERQRTDERAVQRRDQEQRRLADERQAHLREDKLRRERARVALDDGLMQSVLRHDRRAKTLLDEAIRLDPNLNQAYRARGEVRRRLSDVAGALEDFHEAVRRNPHEVAAWLACGELHAGRREHRQAIDAFTAVLRLEPRNAEVYRRRGLSYSRIHEADKAFADQTKAIDLMPSDPWAYLYRANLYRQRNELKHAFDDYTAALERNRDDRRDMAVAYRERGLLQIHWQFYERAVNDLTRALELDATDAAALRARGKAYLHNGEWDNAVLDAESLLRQNGEDIAAYKLRGGAYMGLADYRRAHDDFSRVLRIGRDAETFYLRARAKVHLGDFREAIFDCNDATSIDPRLASAFYLRGKLNLREGCRAGGLDDCRTAHNLDPQYPLP